MNAKWLLVATTTVSLAACVWLYSENRSLQRQLEQRDAPADEAQERAAPVPEAEATPALAAAKTGDETAKKRSWDFSRNSADRPKLQEESKKETRQARRKRRQAEVTALFGRLDGETEEEYRERMVPFLEMTLAVPRSRVKDARRAAEEAAGVTEEQRTQLDAVFADASTEALALTNRALESGDLTPYDRNWSGVMNVAGGLGAILEGTESQIGEILSPEQTRTIYEQGFEWGEYLGVIVPWEELNPPPPPPEPDS